MGFLLIKKSSAYTTELPGFIFIYIRQKTVIFFFSYNNIFLIQPFFFFNWNLLCHEGWLRIKLLQQHDMRCYFIPRWEARVCLWQRERTIQWAGAAHISKYWLIVLNGLQGPSPEHLFLHKSILSFAFADLKLQECSLKRLPITWVVFFYQQ